MSSEEKKDHKVGVFVLAGLSFIPLIGILPGIICIVIALIGRKSNSKLLGGLGLAGILFSVILYGYILPNFTNSEEFAKKFEPHAKSMMTKLIKEIEYYKIQHKKYPNSLEELNKDLQKGEFSAMIYDPMNTKGKPRAFYYELTNDNKNYILFGVGLDGKALTSDDIFPLINKEKNKNIGWVKPNS